MFSNLLVPLDGTKRCERVLPHAAQLAGHDRARVELLQVLAPLARPSGPPEDTRYLKWAAAHLEGLGANRVSRYCAYGTPEEAILREARRIEADLIVMSSHSRRGLDRLTAGSICERVAWRSTCPTLIVPRKNPGPRPLSRILVPLDGSDLCQRSLPFAVGLARDFGSELVLVRLTAIGNEDHSLSYLSGVAREISVPVSCRVELGDPHISLPRLAEEHDLTVLTTHAHRGIKRVVVGSVTEAVLHRCNKPILVVNPEE